jgi:uncharacterized membrane protein YkvA (DUF1232 family)
MAALSSRSRYVRPRVGKHSIGRFRAFFRLMRDPTKGIFSKLLVLAAVAYMVWPVDLIPDVMPVVGWLDDLGFATIAMGFLARAVGKYRDEESAKLLASGS